MCLCSPQQIQAVCAWLGEGLLMPKNNAIGIVVYPSQGDQATPFRQITRAWNRKGLRVGINPRLGVLLQNAAGAPVMEVFFGPGVGVESLSIGFTGLA